MNKTKLDSMEEKLLEEINKGEFKSIGKEKMEILKKNAKVFSKNTINKKIRKKPLNIRLFEDDIIKIKAKALKKGLPYQTYLASQIHLMVNN